MNKKSLLDDIIANSCVKRLSNDNKVLLEVIDLHCENLWIIARRVGHLKYKILFAEMQRMRTDEQMYALINDVYDDWKEW